MAANYHILNGRCNGMCITAYDIGMNEYGNMIAYPHPDCPQHGDPIDPNDEYPLDERYYADRTIDDEGLIDG